MYWIRQSQMQNLLHQTSQMQNRLDLIGHSRSGSCTTPHLTADFDLSQSPLREFTATGIETTCIHNASTHRRCVVKKVNIDSTGVKGQTAVGPRLAVCHRAARDDNRILAAAGGPQPAKPSRARPNFAEITPR
jgi:hypothetical protein